MRVGVLGPPGSWSELAARAREAAGDPAAALSLAAECGPQVPLPGSGATLERWEALATLGAADLTVARTLEPHLDALAILAEAGLPAPPPTSTWGVWAAEGPGVRLDARATGQGHRLDGTKPWCSLANAVSDALVTAWVDDRQRSLFAVSLADPGVEPAEAAWVSRGLPRVTSGAVGFGQVRAREIGGPDWYLRRSGFAWGGIGVAAIWFGGSVAVARRLWRQARERRLDQIGQAHLGAVDASLWSARAVLSEAATAVDAGEADGAAGERWAMRVRQVVVDAAERVLAIADRALGPGPLAAEEAHAAAVADLRIYLRQHHGERDAAGLGRSLLQDAVEDPSAAEGHQGAARPGAGSAPW